MQIKAMLFDVDGTLIDSEWLYHMCWRQAAEEAGCPLTKTQALTLRSLDRRETAKLFTDLTGDPEIYQKIRRRRGELMAQQIKKYPLRAKPGVAALMEYLQKKGIRYAAVTASPAARAREYLDAAGVGKYFETVISAEQAERGKPFPDIYLLACKMLGLRPEECLVAEDSPNGLKSAHDAGCVTVMIPDLTPPDEETELLADHCFVSLEQIAEFDIL